MSQPASIALTPHPTLSCLESGGYSIKSGKVSDSDLLALASMPELLIEESKAPLSMVTPQALQSFLKTHGYNLKTLNLQNTQVNGEELVALATMLPKLKTLSFQYLHKVKDKDLLEIIQTCKDLETLIIRDSIGISKSVYYSILKLDRCFSKLSLHISRSSKDSQDVDASENQMNAQVETLYLRGLSFSNVDVTNAAAIKGLKNVELTHTSVEPQVVVDLCQQSVNLKARPSISITPFSDKSVTLLKTTFAAAHIPFESQQKKVTVNLEKVQ